MSFRDALVLFFEVEFSYVIADDVLVVIDRGLSAEVSRQKNGFLQILDVPDVSLRVS